MPILLEVSSQRGGTENPYPPVPRLFGSKKQANGKTELLSQSPSPGCQNAESCGLINPTMTKEGGKKGKFLCYLLSTLQMFFITHLSWAVQVVQGWTTETEKNTMAFCLAETLLKMRDSTVTHFSGESLPFIRRLGKIVSVQTTRRT
jgi:hypothetical protein